MYSGLHNIDADYACNSYIERKFIGRLMDRLGATTTSEKSMGWGEWSYSRRVVGPTSIRNWHSHRLDNKYFKLDLGKRSRTRDGFQSE